MHRRATLTIFILACAALLFACGDDGDATTETTITSSSGWEGETVTLGSIYSTTGPGKAFGPQQVQAAKLAVKQINNAGGINGAELKLEQVDDASKPARSATAAEKLIDDDALAILGPTFSNSAAKAHPLADERGIAMLATSNTGPGIVGDCDYPCEYVFRDSLGEADAIPANVSGFLESSDAESAVVVHPAADPFGESTAAIAADALKREGIKVSKVVPLPDAGAAARAALQDALSDDPDVLFITASSGEAAADLIRAAREDHGFDGAILGGNAFNSALAAETAGKQGDGARSAAAWYADNDDEANTEFVDAYTNEYGSDPDQFAAQAYAGVQILAEAARNADLSFGNINADREALAAALGDVELATPLGEFSFTEENDVSQPIWLVEMDGKGGYELIERVDPG